MTPRMTGAIIALFVVVAVAATSLRLISFSFQEQAPDGRQAMQQPELSDASNVLGVLMQMQEERQPTEGRPQADQDRQRREAEQRQAELRQTLDEERKLAEGRRQGEQQRLAQVQQREADFARRLEEQRKLTEAWLQEEQERERRKAEQLQADLKRMQEEDRKFGEVRAQPEKQHPRSGAEQARKIESKIAASQAQPEAKMPAQPKTASEVSSTREQPHARVARATAKRERRPACMFFGHAVRDMEDALNALSARRRDMRFSDRDGQKRKIADASAVRAASVDAQHLS
jgi:hypothetical protein